MRSIHPDGQLASEVTHVRQQPVPPASRRLCGASVSTGSEDAGMASRLLSDIERAVRRSWGADTCPPEDRLRWTPDNPARGQCGVTAMVVNDLMGGELSAGRSRSMASARIVTGGTPSA